MAKNKQSTGMKIFLGIALAVILFALFNLGVAAFYDSPQYDDYCDVVGPKTVAPDANADDGTAEIQDYETCYDEYDAAREAYNNNIFYLFVVAGLICAVGGLFITNLSFQIVGLGAGVGLIIEGIARNLNNKVMAFFAALAVFIILSYFVYRKVKD